jgi:hypothetical protein
MRPFFINEFFLKTLIFKIVYFLKTFLIFTGSLHNFGKSDDDRIL